MNQKVSRSIYLCIILVGQSAMYGMNFDKKKDVDSHKELMHFKSIDRYNGIDFKDLFTKSGGDYLITLSEIYDYYFDGPVVSKPRFSQKYCLERLEQARIALHSIKGRPVNVRNPFGSPFGWKSNL